MFVETGETLSSIMGEKRSKHYRDRLKKLKIDDAIRQYSAFEKSVEYVQESSDDIDSCHDFETDTSKKTSEDYSITENQYNNSTMDVSDGEDINNNEEVIYNSKTIEQSEIQELWELVIKSKVSHVFLDGLLTILKQCLLPTLPKCSKTFLQSNIKFRIEPMDAANNTKGEFLYFGIQSNLQTTKTQSGMNPIFWN